MRSFLKNKMYLMEIEYVVLMRKKYAARHKKHVFEEISMSCVRFVFCPDPYFACPMPHVNELCGIFIFVTNLLNAKIFQDDDEVGKYCSYRDETISVEKLRIVTFQWM